MKKLIFVFVLSMVSNCWAYVPTATWTGTPTITPTFTATASPTPTGTASPTPTVTYVIPVTIVNPGGGSSGPTTMIPGGPMTEVNAYPTVQGVSLVGGGLSVTLINPTPIIPSNVVVASPTLTTGMVPYAVGPNTLADSTVSVIANGFKMSSLSFDTLFDATHGYQILDTTRGGVDLGNTFQPLRVYGSACTFFVSPFFTASATMHGLNMDGTGITNVSAMVATLGVFTTITGQPSVNAGAVTATSFKSTGPVVVPTPNGDDEAVPKGYLNNAIASAFQGGAYVAIVDDEGTTILNIQNGLAKQ